MRQFVFFLFSTLFFKAREQIENENGQQLDSEKKAMDQEDEDLLATVAKKVLESSVSEALKKWDELAPSVLDIYYVFILCNTIDWCMNVWTEINFFKIK